MAGCKAITGVSLSACPFAYHRLHQSCTVAAGTAGTGGRPAFAAAEPRYRRLLLALPRAVVQMAGRRGNGANPRGRDRNFPLSTGLKADRCRACFAGSALHPLGP